MKYNEEIVLDKTPASVVNEIESSVLLRYFLGNGLEVGPLQVRLRVRNAEMAGQINLETN